MKRKNPERAELINGKIDNIKNEIRKEFGAIEWTGTRAQFGEYFIPLIVSGLIKHRKGNSMVYFGHAMACNFDIYRVNGQKKLLKNTAILESLKIASNDLTTEQSALYKKLSNPVFFELIRELICSVPQDEKGLRILINYLLAENKKKK